MTLLKFFKQQKSPPKEVHCYQEKVESADKAVAKALESRSPEQRDEIGKYAGKMELPTQQSVTPLRVVSRSQTNFRTSCLSMFLYKRLLAMRDYAAWGLALMNQQQGGYLPHTRGPNVTINVKSTNARRYFVCLHSYKLA